MKKIFSFMLALWMLIFSSASLAEAGKKTVISLNINDDLISMIDSTYSTAVRDLLNALTFEAENYDDTLRLAICSNGVDAANLICTAAGDHALLSSNLLGDTVYSFDKDEAITVAAYVMTLADPENLTVDTARAQLEEILNKNLSVSAGDAAASLTEEEADEIKAAFDPALVQTISDIWTEITGSAVTEQYTDETFTGTCTTVTVTPDQLARFLTAVCQLLHTNAPFMARVETAVSASISGMTADEFLTQMESAISESADQFPTTTCSLYVDEGGNLTDASVVVAIGEDTIALTASMYSTSDTDDNSTIAGTDFELLYNDTSIGTLSLSSTRYADSTTYMAALSDPSVTIATVQADCADNGSLAVTANLNGAAMGVDDTTLTFSFSYLAETQSAAISFCMTNADGTNSIDLRFAPTADGYKAGLYINDIELGSVNASNVDCEAVAKLSDDGAVHLGAMTFEEFQSYLNDTASPALMNGMINALMALPESVLELAQSAE